MQVALPIVSDTEKYDQRIDEWKQGYSVREKEWIDINMKASQRK